MKKNRKFLTIASFLIPLFCLEIFNTASLARGNIALETFKSEIEKRSRPILKKFKQKRKTRGFTYFKGKIEIEELQDQITFHYYKSLSKKSKSKPLILIFPGLTGLTPLDYYMGRYYSKRGYNVAISHYRDEANELDPDNIDISMKNGILASLGVLDTVSEFEEVDSEQIALLGYSFGGIRASFLATLEERLSPVIVIVGSASLSRTLGQSKFPAVRKIREIHMEKLEETCVKKYEEYLKNKLTFEPSEHLINCNTSNYLTVTSKLDTAVPWEVQKSLVSQLTDPQHICFKTLGHCTSVCWFVIRHLNKSLELLKDVWRQEDSILRIPFIDPYEDQI